MILLLRAFVHRIQGWKPRGPVCDHNRQERAFAYVMMSRTRVNIPYVLRYQVGLVYESVFVWLARL